MTLALIILMPGVVSAQDIEYTVEAMGNISSGDFAPYYIGSLNHGRITQKNSALTDISLIKEIDYDSRFSYGFGAEVMAGASSKTDYERWYANTGEWGANPQKPAGAWIQQLYGELKYRQVFLSAGLKEHTPALLNPELSSGDFVESGNARPIPEIRAGFVDFVDVPLTDGWLQIMGQIGYGKMTDNRWLENHYNYYNGHITTGSLYTYRCCFFRTNPEARLMVTLGMQAASFFGGKAVYYQEGREMNTLEFEGNAVDALKMIVPGLFGKEETFVQGSTLGSWDFYAQYMLDNGSEIAAYFQGPWEDGSGIARRNHPDGLWGIEFRNADDGFISEVVLEYIDFRHQTGPIHYYPGDWEGSTITTGVSGKDNYYNNIFYNSYSNYGMSIGTPFLKSPIYNLNGSLEFSCNRANGMHLGAKGYAGNVAYRLMLGYQRGLGTYDVPYNKLFTDFSAMLECKYNFNDHLSMKVQVACDRGDLRGNNFGALLALRYSGFF